MFQALGPLYAIVLPLTGFAVFVGACLVMFCRPAVAASYLVILPLPLLIGIFGCIVGIMQSYTVISMSPTVPKPSDWAAGTSMAIFSIMVGMLVNAPAYFVMAIGLPLKVFFTSGKP